MQIKASLMCQQYEKLIYINMGKHERNPTHRGKWDSKIRATNLSTLFCSSYFPIVCDSLSIFSFPVFFPCTSFKRRGFPIDFDQLYAAVKGKWLLEINHRITADEGNARCEKWNFITINDNILVLYSFRLPCWCCCCGFFYWLAWMYWQLEFRAWRR